MAKKAVVLRALTPESRKALDADEIEIPRFPFRVGRLSAREAKPHRGWWVRADTEDDGGNDLYVADAGKRLNVSRQHFQIERTLDGTYELVDLGSTCGTIVEGLRVGGRARGGRCPLPDGCVIVVGSAKSPYLFKFVVEEARELDTV